MSSLDQGSAVISTVFRILSFLFLRFAPHPAIGKIVAATYALYLTVWVYPCVVKKNEGNWEDKYLKREEPAQPQVPISRVSMLRALVFSLPSKSCCIRSAHLAINTLLMLAALDHTFHPYFDPVPDVTFTRIGAVYPDSAKLVVRYPDASVNATQRDVRIIWREVKRKANLSDETGWKNGPVLSLKESEDWVGTVKLRGLWPSSTYQYKLAYTNKTHLPYPPSPITFKTFPDPRLAGTHFKFIASSCVAPNSPYLPFHSRRIKGFDVLANYLWPSKMAPLASNTTDNATEVAAAPSSSLTASFFLFLGDFIYADLPSRIRDDVQEYRRLYRRNYVSKSFRKVFEKLPMFHAYDDHEFENNFVGLGNDTAPTFVNGSSAWKTYIGNANYDSPHDGENYYDFRYGDVAFFVLDTRRHRTDVTQAAATSQTMLGEKQLAALYQWFAKANATATFKFLITSVPFTSLWAMPDATDSWTGYASERAALLSVMHTIPNLIIISGDRHEVAVVEYLPPTEGERPLLEASVSPLSQTSSPFFGWLLRKQSAETVTRVRTELQLTEEDKEETVVIEEEVPRERLLKGLAYGNNRWLTVEVDTRDRERPMAKLEVWVGGKERYSLEIPGVPVKISYTMALGAFVPGGIKDMLDKIGMKPSKWF